jgi:hypothetical protein
MLSKDPARSGRPRTAAILLAFVGLVGLIGDRSGPARAGAGEASSWALRRPRPAAPPTPRDTAWLRTSVDAFVRQTLEKNDLTPAPPADRLALLRRVHFDLIGLPPSPEDAERFLRDERSDAYERLVDRLLASPHYGERWGRHWLDVVRYADTGGFEQDYTYPAAWRYRDYVFRSFNADKPFDRFIREQVAGDELWPDDPEAVTATAMYCVGPVLGESAMIGSQLEYEWLTDAADTTGSAFLGLTFGCARCHDHKFDPISQRDYYAMQAIFAASDRPFPERVRLGRIKALNGLLSDAPVPKELLSDPRCTVRTEDATGFHLFHRREPMVVHRLHRGELGKEREAVEPGFPAALRGSASGPDCDPSSRKAQRRAELARWLTSPVHPLVARVLVNRVWGWHFGRAIVATPNDFGAMGEEPTHPELLDWLARDLVAHGWSLKHLHRRILLSATYRMASTAGGPGSEKDPEDRLLWRFPRRRLEAEVVRDAMLACSGTLNSQPFGRPVVPPLGKEELTGLFDAKGKWPITRDPAEHARRSVYLLVRRTFAYPLLAAFDPPEMMTSCPRRMETIVPTQALTLLNSPVARQQAAAFAHRLARESGGDARRAAARAWWLAFGRPITEAEARRAVEFLRAHPAGPGSDTALTELALALFNANEFVYLD